MAFVFDVFLRWARRVRAPGSRRAHLAGALGAASVLVGLAGSARADPDITASVRRTLRFDLSDQVSLPLPLEPGDVVEIRADRPPAEIELRLFEPGVEVPCQDREDLDPDSRMLPVARGELRGESRRQILETLADWRGTYRLEVRALGPAAGDSVTLTIAPRRPANFEDAAREESARAFRRGEILAREHWLAARPEFEQSLALARAAGDRRREAWANQGLGWAEEEWLPAIPHFERALELFTEVQDLQGVVQAHRFLAQAAARTGDFPRVDREFEAAAAAARELGDAALAAGIYWRWARALTDPLARLDEARQKLARAQELARSCGDPELLFESEFWLGRLHQNQFDLDGAVVHFEQALDLAPTQSQRATTLNDLATLHDHLGEYQRGRDLLIQAVAVFEEIHLEPSLVREYANALYNLGNVSQRLGDLPTMLTSYERARAVLPPTAPVTTRADLYRALAWAYSHSGRQQEALAVIDEALRLTADLPAENAISRGFFGEVLLAHAGSDAKAIQQAREFLASALTQYSAQPNPASAPLARILEFLGEADRRLRHFPEAQASLERALDLNQRLGSLIDIALDHYFLARIARERGDFDRAQKQVEQALATYQELRARVGPPDAQAFFASARPRDVQEFYVDLLMERSLHDPTRGFVAQALSASERARGQSLLDLVSQNRTGTRDVPPELLAEREAVRRALRGLDLKRSQVLARAQPTDETYARWKNDLVALESQMQQVDERIRTSNPDYGRLVQSEPVSVAEIQGLLDEDTVLLEYLLGDARSYLWVVTRTSVTAFTLSARSAIEAEARELHGVLTRWGTPPSGVPLSRYRRELSHEFDRLAANLGRQLLGPPGALLGRKRLAIVADGALEYVPFGALLDPAFNTSVIEHHAISRLPSASVLAVQRQSRVQGRERAHKQLAIFADPSYVSVPRLAYSREEAERILTSATGTTLVELGPNASRDTALATDLSDYRVLHFAVHGKIDAEFPNFSKLVMSELDAEGSPIDGDLTLTDIYGLSLKADLVVLSACDTALGKSVRGEGLLGLTRGFLYAGADRVLSSLWQVQDEATTRLMDHFYHAMLQQGLSPGDALRSAQNDLRREPGREFPYYWAGFVLQGEWR